MSDLVGLAASVIAFVLWLPQADLARRRLGDDRALAGLSAGTLSLVLCNAVLWGVYAVMTQAWWVGAPGLVNGPLAVWMLVLVVRARRRLAAVVPPAGCGDPRHPVVEHDLVVTAPPGYGYVHSPCTGVQVSGFLVPLGQGQAASARMRRMDASALGGADRLAGQ